MDELIFTIDLEWYYPGDIKGIVKNFDKMSYEQRLKYDNKRIEKSISIILETLKKYNQKITFFVVAELEKSYSPLLKKIVKDGHEIALHSFRHEEDKTPFDFENNLKRCVVFQKKYNVIGYRSPRIKIANKHYKLLKKYNYLYDSSIYGTNSFINNGIKIIPVSTLPYKKRLMQNIPTFLSFKLLSQSIPFGGGMFCALLQKYEHIFISKYHKVYQQAPCLFLHSWQINNTRYPFKSLIRNPSFFAYSIDCKSMLEWICKNYKLLRVKDCL